MKKLFVALAAVACATVSFAQVQWLDWFKIDKDNAETVAWTGDGEVAATETGFTVDTDSTTGLTYTPTAATSTESGRQFTFEFSVEAPVDLTKQEIPDDSKGGITIAKDGDTALAFYVVNYDTDAFVWTKFADAGAAEIDKEYAVTMTVDGAKVTYEIGGQTLQCALPAEATAPAAVTLLGAGSFTEIVGEQAMNAVASITKDEATTYFATFAEAYAAAANVDTISLLENVGEVTLAPAAKTVTVVTNDKTFSVSADSVDTNKVLRCVYENGQIVTALDFDKDANGAYQIANEGDLEKLQKAVAVGTAGADTFKQTADITLTKAWAGIGTYKNKGGSASAFKGTYDGAGHKISNVVMADNGTADSANNYRGFFNQIENATVKDLTVAGTGFGDTPPSGEYGCALVVGHAFKSTIEGCVSEGAIASGTHNVGGIVVRIQDATILNCTNKADITGNYTKVAGIAVINQNDGTPGSVIEGCVNEGTITCANGSNAGRDGCAGILAYVGSGDGDYRLTIKNCSNTGSIVKGESASSSAKVGQLVGYAYYSVKGEGVNTVKADARAVGGRQPQSWTDDKSVAHTTLVKDLFFATVDDNVATLVADSAAVKDANLKVMSPGAPDVVLAEVGDSIELDTSLATVNVTTTAENAEVQQYGNVYTVVSKKPAVAQINDKKYETLAAAVNALTGGETITLLTDYTLAAGEQVVFTKNATLNLADKTLTVLNAQVQKKGNEAGCFAIDTDATVTITGGTLNLGTDLTEDGNGVGGIQVHGAVITDCTIVRGGNNSPVFDIYGASVTVNDGAVLTSGMDVFRFKEENLNSTVIINGGTMTAGNDADKKGGQVMFYNYKPGHVANITINGGTFIQNDPLAFFGTSAATAWNVTIDPSAKFNTDKIESTAGIVLNPGYGPVALTGADEGWYKIDVLPVIPGEDIPLPADKTPAQYADDINNDPALRAKLLVAPNDATVPTTAEYRALFQAVAAGDKVAFELTPAAVEALAEAAETAAAAALAADEGGVSIATPIAGLYYGLKNADALDEMAVTQKVLSDGKAISWDVDKTGAAGFWQVLVGAKNADIPEPVKE